jgi:hypothetical protein
MTDTQQKPKKNWNILVPFFFDDLSNFALQEAISLCKAFEAGLVLFCPKANDEKRLKLAEITAHIQQNHSISVQSFAPEENTFQLLFALASKTESILIVIAHNRSETSLSLSLSASLRKMRKSRTPFLMVPATIHTKSFDNIVYSMSYQKQEKEKILWASYFGRICGSKVHVSLPKVSDQLFKSGIMGNIQAMKKLYENAEIKHEIVPVAATIYKADRLALKYSSTIAAGAYLILTTLRPDIFDFFSGTAEKNAICNEFNIPVLCINPHDDLYVLCN